MIETMQSMRTMMLTMHSTMSGIMSSMDQANDNSTAMGKAFDTSKNDDSFYIAPEVFKNADFKRVMKIFVSPDGKAARMLITQKADPASPEGTRQGRRNKECGRGSAQGNSSRKRQSIPRPAPPP